MITQARLFELYLYDPLTGEFIRRAQCGRHAAGSIPGSIDPSGYLIIMIDGRNYRAHRLAWFYMTGAWPEHEIDHENRIRSDNKWLNIRPATRKENGENVSLRCDSTSGVRGVSWDRRKQRWRAHITHNYRFVELGRHKTKEAAEAARLSAERELFTHSEGAKK